MSEQPQPQSEMEQYASRKNLEARLGFYTVMLIIAGLAALVGYYALTSGDAIVMLLFGVPAVAVIVGCLWAIRKLASTVKR